MNVKINRKTIASLAALLLLSLSVAASADDSTAPPSGNHGFWKKQMLEVREACTNANPQADRTVIHACVKQFHQNFKACSAGLAKPEPGQKPTAEQITAFTQCRTTALSEITKGSSSSN
jgi:hypothetical protein